MIYLDNAATTPLCEAAKKVVLENIDCYYNPSSVYEPARKLRVKVEEAREHIAEMIGARNANEIYFTSSGSEANTWAMKSFNDHVIVCSEIEHSSVLNSTYGVGEIRCDQYGIIDPEVADICISRQRYHRVLCSVMMVNNEIGTIQPIRKIAEVVHRHHGIFHSDMVQAAPHMYINVDHLGVDIASFSGHKFGALKGIGFAYIKEGTKVQPLIYGGSQERGLRGSTINALGILSMEAALRDTVDNMLIINEKIARLSDILQENLLNIKGVSLNALTPDSLLPGILNFTVEGVNGADIVTMADQYGIMISSGSACHEGNAKPSHVLMAIGLSKEEALSSVRISIGRYNTEQEIKYVCDILSKIIKTLRQQY